jgi:hypothetical protein
MTEKTSSTSSKSGAAKRVKQSISASNAIKPVKTFADIVKNTWGYFMTFVAVVTFIWTMGVKSERKTLDNVSIKNDIAELKQEAKKIDSIFLIVNEIQETQSIIIENQNAQRESWVKYLVNKKDLSKKDFLEYMEGLEFQIALPKPVVSPDTSEKYDPNIIIKKLK